MDFRRPLRIYKTMKESLELERFHNNALTLCNKKVIDELDNMIMMLNLIKKSK